MEKRNSKSNKGKRIIPFSVKNKKEIKQSFSNYRKQITSAQKTFSELKKEMKKALKELEAEDKMGNFEIQRLMSDMNEAETLSSSVLKKSDDTVSGIISKI